MSVLTASLSFTTTFTSIKTEDRFLETDVQVTAPYDTETTVFHLTLTLPNVKSLSEFRLF